MMIKQCINIILLLSAMAWLSVSCRQSRKDHIISKISCYYDKLKDLQRDQTYKEVFRQFLDSFNMLKSREKILQHRENKIDQAIFFNKNKDRCILLILQKSVGKSYSLSYGRAVQGSRKVGRSDWHFELSREYSFDKNDLELFGEDSFDNISKLAIYRILADGNPPMLNCEIDEYNWFNYGE